MTDVDAVARLLEVGANAVFLMLLWRVYQDFIKAVDRHANYLEKLTDKLLPVDDVPPPAARAYAPPPSAWASRTPTELGERGERVGM